jgi:hypothetical protein
MAGMPLIQQDRVWSCFLLEGLSGSSAGVEGGSTVTSVVGGRSPILDNVQVLMVSEELPAGSLLQSRRDCRSSPLPPHHRRD